MTEFHVEVFGPLDGRICVTGRGEGVVRVGDEFTAVRRYVPQTRFEEYIEPPVLDRVRPTRAVVTHIHCRDEELLELPPRQPALLSLRTEDEYDQGDVLTTSAAT